MTQYLYFVEELGRGNIKIGVTKNPDHRVKLLQIGNPYKLSIVAVAQGGTLAERSLHRRFQQHRLVGEWFAPNSELTALMADFPSWEEHQNGAPLPVCGHGNDALIALYNGGLLYREMAEILGVTRQAVEQRARALNLPPRRAPTKEMSSPL